MNRTTISIFCLVSLVLAAGGCLSAATNFDPDAYLANKAKEEAQLKDKAERGDAAAQCQLGLAYANGIGVPKNGPEAVRWFLKAAEQGDAAAQYNLGVTYAIGDGIPKDGNEAVKWYRKAAEQGVGSASFNIGLMYASGEGVPKDTAEAVKWYRKGAEQGNANAQCNLGMAYTTGDGVPKDVAEAVKWYRMAAEEGNASAQLNLGLAYTAQRGLGMAYTTGASVPKNAAEAIKWFRKAAEQGNASAQFNLGLFYAEGVGVPKNGAEAVKWYRSAAEQGNVEAMCNLGAIYASGGGVPRNGAEAVRWFRKAAGQGEEQAMGNLGAMYATGQGVAKDEIEALAWFNLAAASGDDDAVKSRNGLERRLGRQMALVAQQRSKAILKELEAARERQSPVAGSALAASDPTTPKSSGSGAIVSAQGLVLTAAHVVADSARLIVVTAQASYEAKILRIDDANDLAILKIEGGVFTPLSITPSRNMRLGQSVSTIGFPNIGLQGFSPKVTRGEISSANGYADDPRSWQISVPVQPGNSGGPLLDENGNLIGVVVAKLGLKAAAVTGDVPQNVNYAVKSAYALALLEPYLDKNTPEPRREAKSFEDMVAQAQSSVVLVLAY